MRKPSSGTALEERFSGNKKTFERSTKREQIRAKREMKNHACGTHSSDAMDADARECVVMFRLARIFSHPSFRPDKIKNEKLSRFLFAKRKMKMGKTKNEQQTQQ